MRRYIDPNLLIPFEPVFKHYGQVAEKAMATRRKNDPARAEAQAPADGALPPSPEPAPPAPPADMSQPA